MNAVNTGPAETFTDPVRKTWETYAASWQAQDSARRHELYQQSLSETCVYRDPLTQASGWNELDAYMQDFQRQIPGGHFVTTWFLTHHQRSVAKWEMRSAAAEVLGIGVSYAEYEADGKIRAMTGFFETP